MPLFFLNIYKYITINPIEALIKRNQEIKERESALRQSIKNPNYLDYISLNLWYIIKSYPQRSSSFTYDWQDNLKKQSWWWLMHIKLYLVREVALDEVRRGRCGPRFVFFLASDYVNQIYRPPWNLKEEATKDITSL